MKLDTGSKPGWASNFLQALVAVLAGNAAYFILTPYLPARARHALFREDLGLVVDFWFCLLAYGVVKMVAKWRRNRL